MRDDAKVNFDSLGPAGTPAQDRRQVTLEPGDRALRLDALTILSHRESFVHLTPVPGAWPASAAAFVRLDDRAADAQLLARVSVVGLGVVAPIGQQPVDADPPARATQRWCQQRGVLTRAVAQQRVDQQVRRVVTRQRQLGPATQFVAFLAGTAGVMGPTPARFQTRGVEAGLFLGPDHPLLGGVGKDRIEQSVEQTFLRRRCCALWRVL